MLNNILIISGCISYLICMGICAYKFGIHYDSQESINKDVDNYDSIN